MQQTGFPFHRAPNAFIMSLPECTASLELHAFETPWGTSDEILCYWNGILLGLFVQNANGKFVKLLPTLDHQRGYDWPSAEAFAATIIGIVTQLPNLEIWCEHDCDQLPVQRANSVEELLRYMEIALSFCTGALDVCPSFSYKSKSERQNAAE